MDSQIEQATTSSSISEIINISSAIDASSDAIFVSDPQGKIKYVNQKFLKLHGLTEEQASGLSISKISHSKNVALKLMDSLNKGDPWSMRHQVISHEYVEDNKPTLVWVKTSIDPIIEIADEISGYIGIQRVINKEVNHEIQAKNKLNRVRDLLDHQEQKLEELKKAHDQAIRQVATKSQFMSSMSHEIRTPLNGVLGMAELLQNSELSNKQSHLTNVIQQSGESLLSLLNDILDLSKIEAGKLELNNSSHDLRLIIEEVASAFSERANRKGLELTCVYPAKEPSLFICDKQRLSQILSNLISNAIKFTDEGEVIIEVIVNQQDIKRSLQFEVRDTGIGIPEEDQGLIFEPFSQSLETLKHASQGTGLGLNICKHLTQLMGGEIGVKSKPGNGSIFWFTAQLERDTSDTRRECVSKKHLLDGLKVLIVDDNTSNSENIAKQLEQWNIQTLCTNNAKSAIESLEQAQQLEQPFSLAILDHEMPDTSGINLARVIQRNNKLPDLPVIMMNTISGFEETTVWTAAGVMSYLTKPVRQSELYDSLVATLSLRDQQPIPSVDKNDFQPIKKNFSGHILIVEDNPVNQELAELMLKEYGCTFETASNGKNAVDLVKDNNDKPFNLVLMDCQMPIMSGYTATKAIRKLAMENHLPIIALTANAMEGDQQHCLEAGMDDYLTKPFTGEQLSVILEKYLSDKPVDEDLLLEGVNGSISQTKIDTPISNEKSNPTDLQKEIHRGHSEAEKSDVLNQKTLGNIRSLQRQGAPDILEKIIGLYLDNSNNQVNEIEEAVKQRDATTIRNTTHGLKSSSANIGADRLAELCKQMEHQGLNNQLDTIDEEFERLKQEYKMTCEALNQIKGTGSDPSFRTRKPVCES